MLRDVAARRLDQLDALPADVGERIRGLQDYDFLEPHARERFDELVKRLQGQVLDQFVAGMSEAIKIDDARRTSPPTARWSATSTSSSASGSAAATRTPSEFLAKHGRFFPGAQTFDDIIDQLAQRMAAMQSLMRSMSPEQRAELELDDGGPPPRRPASSSTSPSSPRTSTCSCRAGSATASRSAARSRSAWRVRSRQIGRLQAMDRLEDALSDVDVTGRPGRHRPRRGARPARRRRRCASSRRSTTSPGGSRRPAT